MTDIYDEPSHVAAEDGNVTIDGPDGVAVTVTPQAAAETSDRLLHAAAQAAGQQREARRKQAERRGPSGQDG